MPPPPKPRPHVQSLCKQPMASTCALPSGRQKEKSGSQTTLGDFTFTRPKDDHPSTRRTFFPAFVLAINLPVASVRRVSSNTRRNRTPRFVYPVPLAPFNYILSSRGSAVTRSRLIHPDSFHCDYKQTFGRPSGQQHSYTVVLSENRLPLAFHARVAVDGKVHRPIPRQPRPTTTADRIASTRQSNP